MFLFYVYLLRSSQAGQHLRFGSHRFSQEHTHGPQGPPSGPQASFLGKYTCALEVPCQVRWGQGCVGLSWRGRSRWCTNPCAILILEMHFVWLWPVLSVNLTMPGGLAFVKYVRGFRTRSHEGPIHRSLLKMQRPTNASMTQVWKHNHTNL